MPSSDSNESTDRFQPDFQPDEVSLDEFVADFDLSPALIVAFGLSVMAFVTFVAIGWLPQVETNLGFLALVLTVPFFAGAYIAVRGLFRELE